MTPQILIQKITECFKWRKERRETFTGLVIGLIDQGNVHHHAMSRGLQTRGSLSSKQERIRRFFAYQTIDSSCLAKALIQMVCQDIPKMDLLLDRTNWMFGKQSINCLVLAVRIGSMTFPLFWSLLPHSGCSDFAQRKELLDRFQATFGFQCIRSFAADREFIGGQWMQYLFDHQIPFMIRIKDNRLVDYGEQHPKKIKEFLVSLGEGDERILYKLLSERHLTIVAKQLKNGENLVICSNHTDPKRILQLYQKRWDIERCFKNMKTQGFNLEQTHMTLLDRLNKLMAMIATAILICSFIGLALSAPFKRTVSSPLYSFFTRGFRRMKWLLIDAHPHFLALFKSAQLALSKSEG